jgi:hypothetical protein
MEKYIVGEIFVLEGGMDQMQCGVDALSRLSSDGTEYQ